MIVRQRGGAPLRQLQILYNLGTIGALTDGQLLERFATDSDEVAELAFSALVERHEAMVWRVCLAIVRDQHEAEDAFQATFLVLVRKARSLWVRDSLGPWLHQVACRTASYLRTTRIRRRQHEQRRAEKDTIRCIEVGTLLDPDVSAAIHEEVNRLPVKYRAPVVLCDLEGRTHQEAARSLGWPIGTVKSRQSQGRRLLRDRLVRRGLGLAGVGAVVDNLRQNTVAATKEVAQNTVNAAMRQSARILTGSGASAPVLTLTHGVLRSIWWTGIRLLAVATLALGIASIGAGVYVCGSQEPAPDEGKPGQKQPATSTAQTPKAEISKEARPPVPGTPRATLVAQQLATRKAKALAEIAKWTRELAEIAVAEYEQLIFPRDLDTVHGEIKLAEAELKRAEERLDWANRMWEKGYVSKAQKVAEELNVQKSRFVLEQAESKRHVLIDYTRDKSLKELRSAVEKARSDELAKEATWELEQLKEAKLARELKTEAK